MCARFHYQILRSAPFQSVSEPPGASSRPRRRNRNRVSTFSNYDYDDQDEPGHHAAQRAFTLIEIMVVIGIMMLIMAIGIPAIVQSMRKDPIRQGVSDVVEACSHARALAILNGVAAEVRFQPKEKTLSVGLAETITTDDTTSDPAASPTAVPPAPAATTISFNAQLSDYLVIEMLDVNFVELKDAEEARVRFYPNGTSDLFTIVLQWPDERAYRKITLDIITGLADIEVIR